MTEEHDAGVKVRSMNGNTRALRGGDWLIFRGGNGKEPVFTLAVAWTAGGRKYGLTVAHPFCENSHGVGGSVFASDSDEPVTRNLKGEQCHKSIKIGHVDSIDVETDSAIISILPHIKIDDLVVALSGNDDQLIKIKFPTPSSQLPAAPPDFGSRLMMFGAARRGMVGMHVPFGRRPESFENVDVALCAVQRFEESAGGEGGITPNQKTKLSFQVEGDCGALYVTENGDPIAMHTDLCSEKDDNDGEYKFTSLGVSLQNIVNSKEHAKKNSSYFGRTWEPKDDGPSFKKDSGICVAVQTLNDAQFPKIYIPVEEGGHFTGHRTRDAREYGLCVAFPDEDEPVDAYVQREEEEKKRED